jgi:hypothetical protein
VVVAFCFSIRIDGYLLKRRADALIHAGIETSPATQLSGIASSRIVPTETIPAVRTSPITLPYSQPNPYLAGSINHAISFLCWPPLTLPCLRCAFRPRRRCSPAISSAAPGRPQRQDLAVERSGGRRPWLGAGPRPCQARPRRIPSSSSAPRLRLPEMEVLLDGVHVGLARRPSGEPLLRCSLSRG